MGPRRVTTLTITRSSKEASQSFAISSSSSSSVVTCTSHVRRGLVVIYKLMGKLTFVFPLDFYTSSTATSSSSTVTRLASPLSPSFMYPKPKACSPSSCGKFNVCKPNGNFRKKMPSGMQVVVRVNVSWKLLMSSVCSCNF